jgi:anti-sigma factor RsiW
MTHEKFIESLNLYLDGELPPHAAAALEREIAGSVDRRRIYRQYCQMQNACGELAERFRDEAAPAPHFRQGAVVELPSRRASADWIRSIGLIAGGAAAACAVFVAVRQFSPATAAPSVASTQPVPAAVPALAPSQPVPYTTTVALNATPAGFRSPWANDVAVNQPVADFSKFGVSSPALGLSVPEVNFADANLQAPKTLQPYGVAPGATLHIEEIDAAAFQFQR